MKRDTELLTCTEVADMFRVDPKTVSRWARQGRLPHFRTPGGHRRYRAGEIEKILADGTVFATEID